MAQESYLSKLGLFTEHPLVWSIDRSDIYSNHLWHSPLKMLWKCSGADVRKQYLGHECGEGKGNLPEPRIGIFAPANCARTWSTEGSVLDRHSGCTVWSSPCVSIRSNSCFTFFRSGTGTRLGIVMAYGMCSGWSLISYSALSLPRPFWKTWSIILISLSSVPWIVPWHRNHILGITYLFGPLNVWCTGDSGASRSDISIDLKFVGLSIEVLFWLHSCFDCTAPRKKLLTFVYFSNVFSFALRLLVFHTYGM